MLEHANSRAIRLHTVLPCRADRVVCTQVAAVLERRHTATCVLVAHHCGICCQLVPPRAARWVLVARTPAAVPILHREAVELAPGHEVAAVVCYHHRRESCVRVPESKLSLALRVGCVAIVRRHLAAVAVVPAMGIVLHHRPAAFGQVFALKDGIRVFDLLHAAAHVPPMACRHHAFVLVAAVFLPEDERACFPTVLAGPFDRAHTRGAPPGAA